MRFGLWSEAVAQASAGAETSLGAARKGACATAWREVL